MSRIVSVWLPRWPIQRFLAAQAISLKERHADKPIDPDQPFVLAVAGAGGPRIAAMNAAAEDAGLAAGEPLADARAKAGFLQVCAADAEADDDALRRLALWATRYTPTASPLCRDFWNETNGADGFFLDIEGAAHLFGGEEKLIADLAGRLDRFNLATRLAVADTPGAAWALSRFSPARTLVLPSGHEAAALEEMPIAALRLSGETRMALRRLGFKTVGTLIDKPRAPFAARFAAELLRRLDQALGRTDEPLVPIVAPPIYHSLGYLLEPILTAEAVIAQATRLMQNLVHVLIRDDVGARVLRLCLYRVDGAVKTVDIGLTSPTRSIAHVTRLIALKLETLAATQDCGFGFEAVGLSVIRTEKMPARQIEFTSVSTDGDRAERCAALVDALRQRLGPRRVQQFAPIESHCPERAEVLTPVTSFQSSLRRSDLSLSGKDSTWPEPKQPRPLLLLPRPEPAKVTALVPEGPPRRFCWRGITHDIEAAQGPERIASEWWRTSHYTAHSRESPHAGGQCHALTRDYYLVEDGNGRRFWLYREGLYGRETTDARWFVQGLFA